MSVTNVTSIVNTLKQPSINIHGVGLVHVDRESIIVGNSAVIARCHIDGIEGDKALKCYFRSKPNTAQIYGERFYPQALEIYSLNGVVSHVDVVIREWIEGETLDRCMLRTDCNFRTLSHAFDRMALQLVRSDYAHGDIKPENIIILPSGEMTLIDMDSLWSESFSGTTQEQGTGIYAHRFRPLLRQNKHIHDHAIATLSIALATLAIDRSLQHTIANENLLIMLSEGRELLLESVSDILLNAGEVAHYRMVPTLKSVGEEVDNIEQLLEVAVRSYTEQAYGNISIVADVAHEYTTIQQPTTDSPNRRWSFDDDELLAAWALEGHSVDIIAKALRRSTSAVRARLTKLRIPHKTR